MLIFMTGNMRLSSMTGNTIHVHCTRRAPSTVAVANVELCNKTELFLVEFATTNFNSGKREEERTNRRFLV